MEKGYYSSLKHLQHTPWHYEILSLYCGGDAQSMAFLLVFVQPFPLFVGSKMMVWTCVKESVS